MAYPRIKCGVKRLAIAGVLVTDPAGDPITISTPKQAQVAATVRLFIASADNASKRVPALLETRARISYFNTSYRLNNEEGMKRDAH